MRPFSHLLRASLAICWLAACGGGGTPVPVAPGVAPATAATAAATPAGTSNASNTPTPTPAPTPTPTAAAQTAAADVAPGAPGCAALEPLPVIPDGARQVTEFGAIADDDLPDDDAIAAALAAMGPGDWLVFPPGTYIQQRSILITRPYVTLWSEGAHLHATNPVDHTLGLRADGVRVYGFILTAVTDIRRDAAEQARISIYRDKSEPGLQTGNVVRGNVITQGDTADTANAAGSVGILVYGASRFTVAGNVVRRTLADGIHVTGASREGRVLDNHVREVGDDLIAMVSYLGEGWQGRMRSDPDWAAAVEAGDVQVSQILVQGNDVADNYWGRGISVVGGRNITVRENHIARTPYGAGVLVAQEGGYRTPGPRNVLIEGNTLSAVQTTAPPYVPEGDVFTWLRGLWRALGPRTGHAAVEIHAIQNSAVDAGDPALAAALALRGVRVERNTLRDLGTDGVRIGVASLPGLIGQVAVVDNRFAQLAGATLRNAGDLSSLFCSGNVLDGAPALESCPMPVALPAVSGATLDCASLPQ
ncbi:MAG: right-handed parallel beta-helix repeat-containing protein [Burkholderiales bacterium]|nr:right-handed parallel beta-helix repeat-containing protein [Burkholderiales bacterium]